MESLEIADIKLEGETAPISPALSTVDGLNSPELMNEKEKAAFGEQNLCLVT
jgi:hypothetical protein